MIRCLLQSVFAVLLLASPALAQPNEIRKSVARISNTAQEPNYRAPWLAGPLGRRERHRLGGRAGSRC